MMALGLWGAQVRVLLDAGADPNLESAGVGSPLAAAVYKNTRTFRVEVEVPNPNGKIRAGGTAEIFISTSGERAHLLPQSAMTLNNNGDLGIRAVVDGLAKFYKVKIVRDTSDGIWLSGLPEKIEVIVVGQEYVIDGRKVLTTYQE